MPLILVAGYDGSNNLRYFEWFDATDQTDAFGQADATGRFSGLTKVELSRYSSSGPPAGAQLPAALTAGGNLKTALLEAIPAGTNKIGNVGNAGTSKTLQRASIDLATSGDATVIAAPGAGNRIKIIHLELHNSAGTDNTIILKDGATAINGDGYVMPTKTNYAFEGQPGEKEIILGDNAAFVINLSASTQISGFCIYRVDA